MIVSLSTTQPLYTPQNYTVSSFALRRTPQKKHNTQTNKQTLPPLPAPPLATHVKENKTISEITRNSKKEIQFVLKHVQCQVPTVHRYPTLQLFSWQKLSETVSQSFFPCSKRKEGLNVLGDRQIGLAISYKIIFYVRDEKETSPYRRTSPDSEHDGCIEKRKTTTQSGETCPPAQITWIRRSKVRRGSRSFSNAPLLV